MDLPKTYDKMREDAIYAHWMEKGYFRASVNRTKVPYTIMIPPPNITGVLHMGHALNNTIQDILIRFKRMQGFEALYLPGTDHAAIATEVKVIEMLAKQGITKDDLGRDGFLEKLWEWYEEYGGTIITQLKKLGASCDWDRTRFTMDEGLSEAVLEVFVRLYREGKIYRGERLVNWCVKCQTGISDAEVEHEDMQGNLYHFRYPIVSADSDIDVNALAQLRDDDFITFATTRPETMLGDTAIAVHPEDERHARYIGQFALVPMGGLRRRIPIIADTYVDPAYGTGVVKITPGHDPNDFEVGQRHDLPRINVMQDDGTINNNGGTYSGLFRDEARAKIIEEMTQLGLYVKTQPLEHAVGMHDRCGTTVEPLMRLQWFVKMDALVKPAIDAYESGQLKFNRERFGKIYMHWLTNIKDWCVSRQLWWGHRIPAYHCDCGFITVAKSKPDACEQCGASDSLRQDEDTLDTWFSSALWPFSTLGWPEKTADLAYFYPTNTLVTAGEIIFFWVARMMFMGTHFMGEIPFTDVFIHGVVRDEQGRKFSKSLGNGIDPLVVIEEFGADVLRLMLVSGHSLDNDTRFFMERLEPARNFLNKVWNATRFVLSAGSMNSSDNDAASLCDTAITAARQKEDLWILSKLNRLIAEVTTKLDEHELGIASQKIVDFLWDECCDWYIEMVKPRLYTKEVSAHALASKSAALATLRSVLITSLKLLHPIAPFITEDLFLALQSHEALNPDDTSSETIMLSEWPVYNPILDNADAERDIERMKEAVRGIRAIRTEKQVPPSQKITIVIIPSDADSHTLFTEGSAFLGFLSGAAHVEVLGVGASPPNGAVSCVIAGATLYLPLDALVDKDKELARLNKERDRLSKEIARVDGKLTNQGFMAKAPDNLVAAERSKREEFVSMLAKVESEISVL